VARPSLNSRSTTTLLTLAC